jgi:hypothetical protein
MISFVVIAAAPESGIIAGHNAVRTERGQFPSLSPFSESRQKSKSGANEPRGRAGKANSRPFRKRFPELEDQLAAFTYQGYQGPGSPDRADAMVWAMTELLDRAPIGPRIVRL